MKEDNTTITLKWKNLRWRVKIREIIYAESYARHVTVHTPEGTYEVVGKLSDLWGALEGYGFVRTHQSFAVNARYIKAFSSDSVILFDGSVIPVSERKRAGVRKKLDETEAAVKCVNPIQNQ